MKTLLVLIAVSKSKIKGTLGAAILRTSEESTTDANTLVSVKLTKRHPLMKRKGPHRILSMRAAKGG